LPINVAQSVGHTQVRRIVIGEVDRRPTADELKRMQALVEEAMQAGAIGVSTALIYPPAVYATTEEIAALAKVAGKYGGRYYTHMRNEGDRLLEAIDEAFEIGRAAGVPVHIFHLKAAGRQNWGKMQLAIARIHAARAKGQQVTADIYPYINNGLGIAAFIHPRHFTRGRDALRRQLDDADLRKTIRAEMEGEAPWENWYRHVGRDWNKVTLGSMTAAPFSKYNGQSLGEVATALKRDEWDVFFNIVKTGAFALPQSMSEANKIRAMQADFVTFCTDVGPDGGSRISSHPRAYGSFPRILSRYVRDLGVLTLEEAVAKMSSRATNELMTHTRGRIAIGQAADCVLFDYDKITDRATLAKPNTPSTGIEYVLVNGQVVLEKGRYTGAKPGRVLRGPGWRR
jgi:N-acyl-D-aspartate/D-glutamate deacylase